MAVPVDASLFLDLDAMAAAAVGAGLVFFCNPNNPTATVHGDAAVKGFIDEDVSLSLAATTSSPMVVGAPTAPMTPVSTTTVVAPASPPRR